MAASLRTKRFILVTDNEWVPAGEKYRVAYGYQSRLLNSSRLALVSVSIVRTLLAQITWDWFSPVPKTFVEVLDRGTGATLRRWSLDAERFASVPTTEHMVKEITADLMLLDTEVFVAKYAPP